MDTNDIARIIDELAEQARTEEEAHRAVRSATSSDELILLADAARETCRARAEELEGIAMLYGREARAPGRALRVVSPLSRLGEWLGNFGLQRDDEEIAETCHHHLDAGLRAYEAALQQPLPGTLKVALMNQMRRIRDCGSMLMGATSSLQQAGMPTRMAA